MGRIDSLLAVLSPWAIKRPVNARGERLETESHERPPGTLGAADIVSLKQFVDAARPASPEPMLLEAGYRGYNLVGYGGRVWALPRTFGPLRIENEDHRKQPGILDAADIASLKQLIDAAGPASPEPMLLEAGYRGYNLVGYGGRVWALPQALGPLNVRNEHERDQPGILDAADIASLKQLIDAAGPASFEPKLIKDGYRGYNLVEYRQRVWALPQTLGPMSIENERERKRSGVLDAEDMAGLKDLISAVGRRGFLRLDIADNCNIRCVMCQLYNARPVKNVQFLDFDLFRRQTEGQLRPWSTVQIGGSAEPLIHPRFGDFLRYLRQESDAILVITTNGKLLDRYADLINATGNCLVNISTDSLREETYEYIRKGSIFKKMMANLELLDVSRITVRLSFTLMNSNIGEYDNMVDFCRARGFEMAAFPMVLRDENGIIPLGLLKESLWFNREKLRFWLDRHNRSDGVRATASPVIDEFSCDAHHLDLSLFADGTTLMCGGKIVLGNLKETSVQELWASPSAREFRRQVDADRGPCMTCDYRTRCLSPSMGPMENHFMERIVLSFSEETRRALDFDRTISDEAALDRFVRDLDECFGVFDIRQEERQFTARRVLNLEERGDLVTAPTRHELLTRLAESYRPQLLETEYRGYNLVEYRGHPWGLPLALGHLDIRHERDRRRPGIIEAANVAALKNLIADAPPVPALA